MVGVFNSNIIFLIILLLQICFCFILLHVEYGVMHKTGDTTTKVKVDCTGLMVVVNTECFKA